jgi:membrane-associated phospholipid phosphatase
MKRTPWLRWAVAAVVVLIVSHLLDYLVYQHIDNARIYETDMGRLLRVMGFLPTWLLAAAALILNDAPLRRPGRVWPMWRRGVLLVTAVAVGGVAAEVFKLLLRRERPRAHDGEYFFRAFSDRPFSTGGLAMPSSHALVAFAAAAMLAKLFPRAAPVWYLLAAGSAYTRLAARAHFLSDVTLAALLGVLVAELLFRLRWASASQA